MLAAHRAATAPRAFRINTLLIQPHIQLGSIEANEPTNL
jgi:hypothetical protein